MKLEIGALVHSTLYKFGTVDRYCGNWIIVKWDHKNHGESIYAADGSSITGSYPMLQPCESREYYDDKWQIRQMDIYFGIQ